MVLIKFKHIISYLNFVNPSSHKTIHTIFFCKGNCIFFGTEVKTMLNKGLVVDAQPIKGFSYHSLVSNSIFHFFVSFTPIYMLLQEGTKILTFLVLICSSGTPVNVVISTFSSTIMSCVSQA